MVLSLILSRQARVSNRATTQEATGYVVDRIIESGSVLTDHIFMTRAIRSSNINMETKTNLRARRTKIPIPSTKESPQSRIKFPDCWGNSRAPWQSMVPMSPSAWEPPSIHTLMPNTVNTNQGQNVDLEVLLPRDRAMM